jgi:hypothetical protein
VQETRVLRKAFTQIFTQTRNSIEAQNHSPYTKPIQGRTLSPTKNKAFLITQFSNQAHQVLKMAHALQV